MSKCIVEWNKPFYCPIFESHQALLRAYYWLCARGSLQVGLKGQIYGVQKGDQTHVICTLPAVFFPALSALWKSNKIIQDELQKDKIIYQGHKMHFKISNIYKTLPQKFLLLQHKVCVSMGAWKQISLESYYLT